jgi:benzoyl-CoA reductase subunit A
MGGQDCKTIKCNNKGRVTNFLMNDKCAAGTGRYLEMVSTVLDVPLEKIGPLSLDLKKGAEPIESYCAVFAQMDIIILLREGRHINDILGGVCEAISKRVLQMLKRIKVEPSLSISGGIAKNIGIVRRIEEQLGVQSHIAFEPQIIGALGAALFAEEHFHES